MKTVFYYLPKLSDYGGLQNTFFILTFNTTIISISIISVFWSAICSLQVVLYMPPVSFLLSRTPVEPLSSCSADVSVLCLHGVCKFSILNPSLNNHVK